jgi:hypothetical protein
VQKAFFQKNLNGQQQQHNSSSLNSSTSNSELGLASPSNSLVKVKNKDVNKENKLHRFGGVVMNGGTLVFGKIKSLWAHNVGLNLLADADRRQKSKSKENLGLDLTFHQFC